MAEALTSEASPDRRLVRPAAAVGTVVHQTWWLALGLLATVVEQAARVADLLVEKGRAIEPTVLSPVRRAASEVTGAAGGAGARFRLAASRVELPSVLQPMGRPTKEEFEKLAEEVRELRDKMGEKVAEVTKQD